MTETVYFREKTRLVTLPNRWSVHVFTKPEGYVDPEHPENYRVEWGRLFMRVPRWKEYHEVYLNTLEEIEALAHAVCLLPTWGRYCPYCDPEIPLHRRAKHSHEPSVLIKVAKGGHE